MPSLFSLFLLTGAVVCVAIVLFKFGLRLVAFGLAILGFWFLGNHLPQPEFKTPQAAIDYAEHSK